MLLVPPRVPFKSVVSVLARVGFAAEGFVYLAVGVLAALAAVNVTQEPLGAEGALATASFATAGRPVLLGVGVGLLALAVWELLVALLDLDQGTGRSGAVVRRISSLIAAILYAGLGSWALRAGNEGAGSGGEQSVVRLTAAVLEQPLGQWLLGAAAAAIFAFALTELIEAWGPGLSDRLGPALSRRARRVVAVIGRIGVTARGAVVGLMGWFVLRAAISERSSEARGLGGTLQALEAPLVGPLLLGMAAGGLTLYGVWRLLNALFARVQVP